MNNTLANARESAVQAAPCRTARYSAVHANERGRHVQVSEDGLEETDPWPGTTLPCACGCKPTSTTTDRPPGCCCALLALQCSGGLSSDSKGAGRAGCPGLADQILPELPECESMVRIRSVHNVAYTFSGLIPRRHGALGGLDLVCKGTVQSPDHQASARLVSRTFVPISSSP